MWADTQVEVRGRPCMLPPCGVLVFVSFLAKVGQALHGGRKRNMQPNRSGKA
jgi:hypothetical protein